MTYADNIIPVFYKDVADQIRSGWDAGTSAYENWGEENIPAETGQCAVTALLVQKIFGGILKRALVNGVSHYWNEIHGETVDLTRAQFTLPLTVENETERERSYVLSFPITQERYDRLSHQIHEPL